MVARPRPAEDLVLVRGERFAEARRVRAEIGVHALEIAALGDELRRGLVADARNPGDVVGRVALERLEVDHLIRPRPYRCRIISSS